MKKILFVILASAILLTACVGKTTYTTFASCLDTAEANFYGAFWCPNCEQQKKLFKDGVDALPYIDCDKDGKNNQYITCQRKNIRRYPTWIFEDGERLEGVQSLETLSERTSCALPIDK